MRQRHWAVRLGALWTALAFALTMAAPALAELVTLKKGADVHLVFDSSLSSKTAREGDKVEFHVADPVVVDGKTVISEGTKVAGTVVKVHKRGRYGVNARIQLQMSPLRTVTGKLIPIGFKTKGQYVSNKTGEAAGATAAGAIVLGPIGLVAGAFIPGKQVNAKPGDKMTVTTDEDITLNVK